MLACRSALFANSPRYPAMPSLFVAVALGTYVEELYSARKHVGVIVVAQLDGTVAKDPGATNAAA